MDMNSQTKRLSDLFYQIEGQTHTNNYEFGSYLDLIGGCMGEMMAYTMAPRTIVGIDSISKRMGMKFISDYIRYTSYISITTPKFPGNLWWFTPSGIETANTRIVASVLRYNSLLISLVEKNRKQLDAIVKSSTHEYFEIINDVEHNKVNGMKVEDKTIGRMAELAVTFKYHHGNYDHSHVIFGFSDVENYFEAQLLANGEYDD